MLNITISMNDTFLRDKNTVDVSKLQWWKFSDFSQAIDLLIWFTKQDVLDIYYWVVLHDDSCRNENNEKLYSAFYEIIESNIPVNYILHFIEYMFITYKQASLDKIEWLGSYLSYYSFEKSLRKFLDWPINSNLHIYVSSKKGKRILKRYSTIVCKQDGDYSHIYEEICKLCIQLSKNTEYNKATSHLRWIVTWNQITLDSDEALLKYVKDNDDDSSVMFF